MSDVVNGNSKNIITNEVDNFENKNEIYDINSNKNNNLVKWSIPKNIPNWEQEKVKNFTVEEKKKYELIKKSPKKSGRYVEVNKNFYTLSIFDFMPFFLGHIYSIVKVLIAYGDAKRTVNFNKKMMWDFKNNLLISLIVALIFSPILIITLFIFFPYIMSYITDFNESEVTYGWMYFIDNLKMHGIDGLGDGIVLYINQAIAPLFGPKYITITMIFWFFISMANYQTFLFWFLFRFNRKVLYEIQKNHVKDEIDRIKNYKNN